MRCGICNYRLWNIRSRRCPECGTEFLPSEHDFVLNSVQFCCPHCNTAYYGTGEKGHLVPAEFDCVSCKTHIHMDEMVLLPTEGIEEEQTNVDQMPWLNRREIGGVRAWFRTVGMALVHPARLMSLVPVQEPTRSAIGFAVLSNTLVNLTSVGVFFALPVLIGVAAGGGGMGVFGVVAALSIAFLAAAATSLVTVLLWGLTSHGLLRLTGQTSASLGRTYQAIGYSAGANALTAIPVCGFYVGWIWWAISATIMLKEGQNVHAGRAAFAVLTPPLLGVCGVFGVLVFMGISAGGSNSFTSPWTNTTSLTESLHGYALPNNNRLPDHAIQLITDGFVIGDDFVLNGSLTRQKKIVVGGISVDQYHNPPTDEQIASVDAAIKAHPPNIVAHRLGDFVFTYHGFDLGTADPGLWLVVEVPERPSPSDTLFSVGYANGSTTQFPISILSQVPKEQNALRAKFNLPPLPILTTVTHDQPGVYIPDGVE